MLRTPSFHFAADLERAWEHTRGTRRARVLELILSQGVWALAVYRIGRWAYRKPGLRKAIRPAYSVAFKAMELMTGIRLPARAAVGPGLRICGFGEIIVSPNATIGSNCTLSSGVTVGVAGGRRPGAPRLGNSVVLLPGAKVLGAIEIGDGATIGPNTVAVKNVPAGALVLGMP